MAIVVGTMKFTDTCSSTTRSRAPLCHRAHAARRDVILDRPTLSHGPSGAVEFRYNADPSNTTFRLVTNSFAIDLVPHTALRPTYGW
jgi:hypothetical protein